MISIIIPIYNSEGTLEECLDSIIMQNFIEYEVLMIDDGSLDRSANICKSYSTLDNRFKYYYKENGGVSSARNYGLEKAQGEKICFIDSDDSIAEDYLNTLDGEDDLIILGAKDLVKGIAHIQYFDKKIQMIDRKAFSEFVSVHAINVVWGKLFKKNIIEKMKLRFDERFSYGEDTLFVTSYITGCNQIEYKSDILYNYRVNQSNSLSSNVSIKTIDVVDYVFEEVKKVICLKWDISYCEKIEELQQHLNFCRMFQVLESKNMSFKNKLKAFRVIQKRDWYKKMLNNLDEAFKGSYKIKLLYRLNISWLIVLFYHILNEVTNE